MTSIHVSGKESRQKLLALLGELRPEDVSYVNEECLNRYLRARDYDLRAAADMLLATLKWRKEFGVDRFKMEDFQADLQKGSFYIAGYTSDHVPVLLMTIFKKRMGVREEEEHSKFLCHTLEACGKIMEDGVAEWTWLLNLKDYTIKGAPSLSLVLKMVKILQNHYPERMGGCYLVDAPKVFSVIFKIVYRFVDPNTRDKVFFAYTDDYDNNGIRKDGKEDSANFGQYVKFCRDKYDIQKFKAYLKQAR